MFIGGADDTNDRHHLTNIGKNRTGLKLTSTATIIPRGFYYLKIS